MDPRGSARPAPIPCRYGLHQLDAAHETGELGFVEGETDRLTAGCHGVPALGIPGATLWKCVEADILAGITRVWLLEEPGAGGQTFVQLGVERLRALGFAGAVTCFSLNGMKDLNDLHWADPDHTRFLEALDQAKRGGRTILGTGQTTHESRAAEGQGPEEDPGT